MHRQQLTEYAHTAYRKNANRSTAPNPPPRESRPLAAFTDQKESLRQRMVGITTEAIQAPRQISQPIRIPEQRAEQPLSLATRRVEVAAIVNRILQNRGAMNRSALNYSNVFG